MRGIFSCFLKILLGIIKLDKSEVVVNYIIDVLEGHLVDKYSSVEGRIVII